MCLWLLTKLFYTPKYPRRLHILRNHFLDWKVLTIWSENHAKNTGVILINYGRMSHVIMGSNFVPVGSEILCELILLCGSQLVFPTSGEHFLKSCFVARGPCGPETVGRFPIQTVYLMWARKGHVSSGTGRLKSEIRGRLKRNTLDWVSISWTRSCESSSSW